MFLRRNSRTRGPHAYAYWSLVETYRTARGPRQRVIACRGDRPPDDSALLKDRGKPQEFTGRPLPVGRTAALLIEPRRQR